VVVPGGSMCREPFVNMQLLVLVHITDDQCSVDWRIVIWFFYV